MMEHRPNWWLSVHPSVDIHLTSCCCCFQVGLVEVGIAGNDRTVAHGTCRDPNPGRERCGLECGVRLGTTAGTGAQRKAAARDPGGLSRCVAEPCRETLDSHEATRDSSRGTRARKAIGSHRKTGRVVTAQKKQTDTPATCRSVLQVS